MYINTIDFSGIEWVPDLEQINLRHFSSTHIIRGLKSRYRSVTQTPISAHKEHKFVIYNKFAPKYIQKWTFCQEKNVWFLEEPYPTFIFKGKRHLHESTLKQVQQWHPQLSSLIIYLNLQWFHFKPHFPEFYKQAVFLCWSKRRHLLIMLSF